MTERTKDYSSISPSARTLLWMKALTDIPFARTAARLIFGEAALPTEGDERITLAFLKRLLHFDARYWSIDAALKMLHQSNVLEISSGFSFRGLEQVIDADVFYVDTDLPEVITLKESLLQPLLRILPEPPVGQLLLRPLNALDEEAFVQLSARFPPGRIAVVNEGLLVYLDESEKRRLCATIRKLLKQRGGYWITGDIYVRKDERELGTLSDVSPAISKFLADHHVHENKFGSFHEAETFFLSCGLRMVSRVGPEPERLRSMVMLKEKLKSAGMAAGIGDESLPLVTRHRIRETWILEPTADH